MFCPKCRYEYKEGVTECPDCKVSLVAELPPEPELDYVELVTVLETGDPAIIAVAKSILEAAGIRYFAKNEALQELFGLGRIGTGYNPVIGPVKIQVGRDDVEEAIKLLQDLGESDPEASGLNQS